ncbi:MAG TPA: type II toxin-antitoxin system death-on-curing family toxin [Myxococcaceae bacterium]
MSTPDFLTLEEVLALHARSLELFGGGAGIRDRGLLESAVAAPQSGFGGQYAHSSLFEMAAAYAFHIAQNQPFVDGNKRAGLGSALLFLELNGVELDDPQGQLYDAMIALAERRMDKVALAKLLEQLASSANAAE